MEPVDNEFNLPVSNIQELLSPEERLKRAGLPGGLTPKQANAITQSRLQFALSALAEMNVDRVNQWLGEVGAKNPSEAIRLFLELLEFRMPRMKAAQVIANLTPTDGAGGKKELRDMTIDELQAIVSEQ